MGFFTQLKQKNKKTNPKKHTSSLPLDEDIGLDLYPPISKYQLIFEETQGIYLQTYLDCCWFSWPEEILQNSSGIE